MGDCKIEDDAGNPHFGKGEYKAFVVRAPRTVAVQVAAPTPSAEIRLMDFAFVPEPALRAGKQTIRIVNAGNEPHDVAMMSLPPGMTLDDLRNILNPERARRSQPAEQESAPDAGDAPAPELPPVESLTPESDFKAFMRPKVKDALRRVALKKLFSDPRFNVADPFEAYSGDWTGGEPIPEEMLAALNQAKRLLFDDNKEADGEKKEPEKTATPDSDEPGRKDA